jgi:heme-binding NEAT domain protein
MQNSTLVGYMRKSANGGALRISVSKDAFDQAQKYQSKDGKEYVNLVVNLSKTQEVINGERAVTSVCQVIDSSAD